MIAQMVVPKRAAMLLDRIMVALHHALEDGDKEGVQRISDLYAGSRHANKNAHLNKEQAQHYMGNKFTATESTCAVCSVHRINLKFFITLCDSFSQPTMKRT